jgi:flagellar basal-body rod modification protein FlgD
MAIAATSSSAASAASSDASRKSLTTNFETFLTLLTAQIKNQDPLSPMDSTEFTNQLVQYSGVEQQLKTNDLLKTLTDTTKVTAGATAVAYLGKEATSNSSSANLPTNGTAKWTYELGGAAKSTSLRVLDSSGRVIRTIDGETTTGKKTFTWDGKDNAGRTAPAGTYSLEINSTGADGKQIASTVSMTGIIDGVDLSGTTASVTINGAKVPLSSIVKIGMPTTA